MAGRAPAPDAAHMCSGIVLWFVNGFGKVENFDLLLGCFEMSKAALSLRGSVYSKSRLI